jgi:hypothetical protein
VSEFSGDDFFKYGRLYELHKSNQIADGKRNSDVLQIARAAARENGGTLSPEQFRWIQDEVEKLQESQKKTQEEAKGSSKAERTNRGWVLSGSGTSNWFTSAQYQSKLWKIPDKFKAGEWASDLPPGSTDKNPVRPLRLKNGTPVDFNNDDPVATQNYLQSIDFSQVSHDPRLRDAWHAAKAGKLADLMRNKSAWMASTDIHAVQSGLTMLSSDTEASLTAPLKELLRANEKGKFNEVFYQQIEAVSSSLPTHELAKMNSSEIAKTLHSDSFGAMMVKLVPESLQTHSFAVPGGEVGQSINLDSLRKNPQSTEADYENWHRALVASHENQVARKIVSERVKGYQGRYRSFVDDTTKEANRTIADREARRANAASRAQSQQGQMGQAGQTGQIPLDSGSPTVTESFLPGGGSDQGGKLDIRSILAQLAAHRDSQDQSGQPGQFHQSGSNQNAQDGDSGGNEQSGYSGGLDALQAGLDIAGIADPTPIADLSNAGISLYRAMKEPHRAGEHLSNAFISGISAIPYVGDLAKVVKYGGKAAHAAKGGGAAAKQAAHAGHAGTEAAGAGAHQGNGVFGSLLSSIGGGGSGVMGTIGNVIGGFIGDGSGGGGGSLPPGGTASNPGGGGGGGDNGQNSEGVNNLSRVGKALTNIANVAGPAGIALYAFGSTIQKVSDWLKKIDSENRKILEENRNLATYNGQMAAAYMQLDADRMIRDIHRGEALAGPVSRLAKAQSSFEGSKDDLFTPFNKVSIDIKAGLTNVASAVIDTIDYFEKISEFIDWVYGKEETDGARNAIEKAIWMSEERSKPKGKL